MNTMIPLYGPEDLRALENRIRFTRGFCWALGLAALALCVALCLVTNAANAERTELGCVAVWTLAGWLVLYLRRFTLAEGKYELQHAEMLTQGLAEAEILRRMCSCSFVTVTRPRRISASASPCVTVTKEQLHILRSIRITMVTLESAGGTRRLKVCRSRVKKLQAAGDELTLYVVNGYIAGYCP